MGMHLFIYLKNVPRNLLTGPSHSLSKIPFHKNNQQLE